ncbi:MAG: hypothetical protein ACI8PQ_002974, partial [Planctomycetota bacterium]
FNRSRSLYSLAIALALFCVPTFGHVGLDSPNGGESYCAGNDVTIQWTILISHTQNNWDLEYSTTGANGPFLPLATDLPPGATNVGSVHTYVWTVPDIDSSQMRIRVTMDNTGTDYNDTSLGDFSIAGVGSATATFRNDAGNTNPTGFKVAAPVLGTTWMSWVDNTSTGNTFAGVVGFASSLEVSLSFGVLLVNVGDPAGELLNLPATAGTGVVAFSTSIPNDTALCGITAATQGFGFGGGSITLHNAYDLTVGA